MHPLNPSFYEAIAADREREIQRGLRRAELLREARRPVTPPRDPVLLRLERDEDQEALARLACFEGLTAPAGRHVVAEVGGTIVAAMPLGGGDLLADPFRRTAHLEPLLELRARQITGVPQRRWSLAALVSVWRWSRA
jgi:hypothetical protein